MVKSPHTGTDGTPAFRAAVLSSLNAGSLGVTVGFGLTGAILMSPAFATPLWVLMLRALFIALLLWGVFVAVQRLPASRLPLGAPRWLLTIIAVPLAALLGTLLVYLVAVGGRFDQVFGNMARASGFVITAVTALALGLVVTLVAQVREREQRERAQALAFELERSRLEKQALDARLALLTAQIQPHFLFNTLANVQALVELGSPRAPALLGSLIDYLRAAMPRLGASEPRLGDELKLVRAYLDLMKMRMPDRLQFSVLIDEAMTSLPFPPMALLTLVENAVRHGVDPLEGGGQIRVEGRLAAGVARVAVVDDGPGMAEHAQPGTGLNNLRERLRAVYGPEARLELTQPSPQGLRAEVVWPVEPPRA